MRHSGFTLVEVAVAGSLIGLSVLSAVAIIPAGLRIQNDARMRAAAAATVMNLSAEAGTGVGTVYNVAQRLTAVTPSELTALNISRWESNGAITATPTDIYRAATIPPSGDLARRLLYTLESTGGVRVITVWLLSKDPTATVAGPRTTRYLTTFVERA
jgi:sensor domain CHASE-containing protein